MVKSDGSSAEGAIQCVGSPAIPYRSAQNESRIQRWRFWFARILGRCPRLLMNAAPLALDGCALSRAKATEEAVI
jgi:hypothetical protein